MTGQPLTDKRRAAISTYVIALANGYDRLDTISSVVDLTLKAERMKADDLYAWLNRRQYRYHSKLKMWRLKR